MPPTVRAALAMDDVEAYLRTATFVDLFQLTMNVRAQMGDLVELHDALMIEFNRRGIKPPQDRRGGA